MSNTELEVLDIAVALAQPSALLWVIIRRRGMRPILIANLLFGVAVFAFVWPYLPAELAYIRAGEASELFDYKNAILTVFEIVTLLGSAFAWRGVPAGKIVAWIGFCGNVLLSLLAVLFTLTFKFKCCGYL